MEEEIVEIEDDDPSYEFFYFDNDGVRRGPYSERKMHEWHTMGHFPAQTLIEAHLEVNRKTLGEYIAENGHSTPFSFGETIPLVSVNAKIKCLTSEIEQQKEEKQNLWISLEKKHFELQDNENEWRRKFEEMKSTMSNPKLGNLTNEIMKLKRKIADVNQQKTNCINSLNRQKEKWKKEKLKLQKESEDALLATNKFWKTKTMEMKPENDGGVDNLRNLLKQSENVAKQLRSENTRLRNDAKKNNVESLQLELNKLSSLYNGSLERIRYLENEVEYHISYNNAMTAEWMNFSTPINKQQVPPSNKFRKFVWTTLFISLIAFYLMNKFCGEFEQPTSLTSRFRQWMAPESVTQKYWQQSCRLIYWPFMHIIRFFNFVFFF